MGFTQGNTDMTVISKAYSCALWNMILVLGGTIMILVHNSAIMLSSAGVLQLSTAFQKAVCQI
jgi:hypothetical protein